MAKKKRTTAQRKKEMLDVFPEFGTVTHACRAVGIGRRTHYDWIDDDPEYAEAFRQAEEESTDVLEEVAIRRAKESSDTLLIFLLKGRKPWMYRDRYAVEHTGKDGGPIETSSVDWSKVPIDLRRQVLACLEGDDDRHAKS